ncbi:MAG: hypothetical protein RLZZ178_867 [Verrucomicrobiota bacterium]
MGRPLYQPSFPMRIFVDGTESFWRPENRTGIQRVVREVCRRCAEQAPAGTTALAVQFDGRRWGEAIRADGPAYRLFARCRDLAGRGRSFRRLSRAKWAAAPSQLWHGGAMAWGVLGTLLGSAGARLMRTLLRAAKPVELRAGDVLLVLDYPVRRFPSVAEAKAKGVRVVSVIYDCVPLSHSQFYPDDEDFAELFRWSAANAEGIMTISAYSEQEIRLRLPASGPWVGHFHLGADFKGVAAGVPRSGLAEAFRRPCFLMVGTLAPHKNHAQALDAMELLWEEGVDASLLIIGKVGWQADVLLGRISTHAELGRRLFVVHDMDDASLAHAYGQAHALIAASYVEGFGLPLVEALGRGLSVIASDIPVFREIAGAAVDFFPLEDPAALAAELRRKAAAPRRRVEGWNWLSWDESTRLLLENAVARLKA